MRIAAAEIHITVIHQLLCTYIRKNNLIILSLLKQNCLLCMNMPGRMYINISAIIPVKVYGIIT